jgi:hypothetical protein
MVGFDHATFSGGTVGFNGARLSGGVVDLSNVGRYDKPPKFDSWTSPPSGLRLPDMTISENRRELDDGEHDSGSSLART